MSPQKNLLAISFILCSVLFSYCQSSTTQFDPFLSQGKRSFPFMVFNPTDNSSGFKVSPITSNSTTGFNFETYDVMVNLKLNIFKKLYQNNNYQLAISGHIDNQFVFREENSSSLNGIRHTFLNADYFFYVHNDFVLNENNFLRVNFFHRSSHLGDDFLLLNNFDGDDGYWANDQSNYESIEVFYAFNTEKTGLYAGISYMVRTDSDRKNATLQQGGVFKNFRTNNNFLNRLFLGYDLRFLENNDYNLDINAGLGYAFKNNNSLRIEYYNGYLPYTRLEKDIKTSWLSLAFYYNLEL